MLRNYFRYMSFDVQSSAEIRRTNFTIKIHCFSQMIHQIRQNRIPCSNVMHLQKFSVKFFWAGGVDIHLEINMINSYIVTMPV